MNRFGQQPPALETLAVPTVDTATAAHYLDRSPQTLRIWACKNSGPIAPRRVAGRLQWLVADIRKVLGVQA